MALDPISIEELLRRNARSQQAREDEKPQEPNPQQQQTGR